MARAWQQAGDPGKALEVARKLVEEYPGGAFAVRAKQDGLLLPPPPGTVVPAKGDDPSPSPPAKGVPAS